MIVLAGDVGGTKTALALFDKSERGLVPVRDDALPSRGFASLEAAIEKFLGAGPRPAIAAVCLGVAGPVVDGRCVATNLPWVIDEGALAAAIPAARVKLLNDLEVAAHGVLGLPEAELRPLQAGVARRGNQVLIAAGTGLGEAVIVHDDERRIVIASEGGHGDFAPRGELEDDLLRFLRKEFGSVSYERVLSGPGLVNVYRFLRDTGWAGESPDVAERMRTGDPGAVISEMGLGRRDRLCDKALDIFVSVYGAEAGNLALKAMATGGVLVGGGIAPRIIERIAAGGFVAAFRAKGRLSALMETLPVSVALNPRAPLLGAGRVAAGLC
ncbi:MAG TPA: glucokinase [Methylomirabilota bacterium]|nr:glucokinase [Methylomirabilota bacterium]